MAYNNLSGTVLLPSLLTTQVTLPADSILSGNLSTSDGAEVINVPRVSNATNNAIVTNVGGNANTLTCESNLKFDGSTLTFAGNISGSGQAQFGSLQVGSLKLNHRTITNTATASATDYYIGTDSTNGPISIRLPSATTLSDGQAYVIKDETGMASNNNVTILASGSQTIDGQNSVVLESPFASLQLYCNGANKYFIY